MNARQLEVFEAVMRTGSLTLAARALGVSQPAVSKSLRQAEQAAGFVLFRRVHGRLFPSTEAETLLPHVARVRTDLDAIGVLIRELRDGGAGTVTVATSASIAHVYVTPAMPGFCRAHPNIRVEVLILPTAMVADRVADNQADLGVVHQPTDSPYLHGEVIAEGEAVCALPRRHPLAERRTLGARDLQKERLICYREDTLIGRRVRQALIAAGRRREVEIVVNQSTQALDLVEAGAGIAVTEPFLMVTGDRPALAAVPFRPSIPNLLRIIRARERPRSRAAARFETAIREVVARRSGKASGSALVREASASRQSGSMPGRGEPA